jgi:hypothetical protein
MLSRQTRACVTGRDLSRACLGPLTRIRSLTLITATVALLGGGAAFAAFVPAAYAGTYTVLTCPGDEGWTTGELGNAAWTEPAPDFTDACAGATTGGLALSLDNEPTAYSAGFMSFSIPGWPPSSGGYVEPPPPGGTPFPISISSFTLNLSAYARPNGSAGEGEVLVQYGFPTEGTPPVHAFEDLGAGTETPTVTAGPALGADAVTVNVVCTSDFANPAVACTDAPGASADVTSATFRLASTVSPIASGFTGSLLNPGVQGTASLSFTASEPVGPTGFPEGPGIYNVAVLIDGATLYSGTPDINDGECVRIGTDPTTGGLEFEWIQPCPQSELVDVPVNTSGLTAGLHNLKVIVTDAAGDSATVLNESISTGVATPSSLPNAAPESAASVYSLLATSATSHLGSAFSRQYDKSAVLLSGTLKTPEGAAAAGVPVSVWAQPAAGGAFARLDQTTTTASGRWTLSVPDGGSRLLVAGAGDDAPPTGAAGTLSLRETVTPSVVLHVGARSGGRLVFSGQLEPAALGAPSPVLLIESRDAAGWQTIGRPVTVSATGTFRYVYAAAPAATGRRFAFRAITTATSVWPAGVSRVTSATVR